MRLLALARKIVAGLRVDERRIAQNLRTYGPFAGSEAVMMEAVKAGGNRQELHESIRDAAMLAHERLAAAARTRSPTCSWPTSGSCASSIPRRFARCSIRPITSATLPNAHAPSPRREGARALPAAPRARRGARVNKGLEVARGKTKALYEKPGQPDVLIVQALDSITAGDGARRDEIDGKGSIAAKTTAACSGCST
jgi:hypothetical protein